MNKQDQIHALLGFWLEYSLAQSETDVIKQLAKAGKATDKFFKKYKLIKK